MKKERNIELLCPAGDLETLKIAVIYGAINHNNPYSPVGKDMSSAVTTSGAGQTG